MRPCYLSLTAAAVFAVLAAAAYSAWGPSGCGPNGRAAPGLVSPFVPAVAASPAPSYQWRDGPSDPDQVHLYQGGVQVGTYRYSDGLYYPYSGAGWGSPAIPPAGAPPVPGLIGRQAKARARKAPCACAAGCSCDVGACLCSQGQAVCAVACSCGSEKIAPPTVDYGMAWRAGGGPETYTLNGIPVERAEGIQAIEAGVPDDRHKRRLTVIGPEAERKRVEAELRQPHLAGLLDRLLVQTYTPDHWQVKDYGFVTSGSPTVYLQGPPDAKGRGPVLHRQDDGDNVLAALRRADPDYRRELDPDLRKQAPAPDGSSAASGWLPWLLLAVALWLVWTYTPRVKAGAR